MGGGGASGMLYWQPLRRLLRLLVEETFPGTSTNPITNTKANTMWGGFFAVGAWTQSYSDYHYDDWWDTHSLVLVLVIVP